MTWFINFKNALYIIVLGLLGYTVASITIYHAYDLTSSSLATLILFTHPVIVMILEKLIHKKPFTTNKVIALILTIIGLSIILLMKNMIYSTLGITFAFIASLTYAIFCFGLTEKNTQKLNGIAITAYIATITAMATGIQCLVNNEPLVVMSGLPNGIALAILSTIIASITFYEGLSIVGASSATLISSVEPIFVVVLGYLFLSEPFSMRMIIGGLIIVLAVVILERKNRS